MKSYLKAREIIGSTDPKESKADTTRARFGKNRGDNAIHGSDSDENAIIESDFFFSKIERF